MDTTPHGRTGEPAQDTPDAPGAAAARAGARLGAVAAALAGRYRVERELGRGGMATVYLAEDLRHRRRVAVKVLHPDLGAALGAVRFLREIEVTAALHHPHILPLHDSGEAGGLLYYVMPYVEGESLRGRLNRERQLPVEEAVRVACDAGGALDYAHRHGVVHRDLKPENVLLHDGRALVADFGIARAVQRAADGDTLTGTGVTVGTPHYMSPEQAAGERELDARTDVYALGCVLYEMLAGAPPFTAPTAQGVVAKVMTEEPRPLSGERRTVPPHVAAAVHRALQKLPADRFATAAQFAAALAAPAAVAPSSGAMSSAPTTAAPARPLGAFRLTRRDAARGAFALALALALAAAAFAAAIRRAGRGNAAVAAPIRFTLALADSQRLADARGPVAISPDGRAVAYVGEEGTGRRALYLRPLDDLRARRIVGTEGASGPFFSPDGRWIGFVDAAGRLHKVPVGGGSVAAVADIPGGDGGAGRAWGPNDVIVAGSPQGLLRVPAAGGTPGRLTAVDAARGEEAHTHPLFLPDGKTVAFRIALASGPATTRVGLVPVDARPPADGRAAPHTTLDVRGTPLGYADGMLILAYPEGTVAAVPVDLRRGVVTGEPVPLLDQLAWNGGPAASLAKNGSLVYVRGAGGARLVLVDERGVVVGGADEPRRYRYPRVSPDGGRIAVEISFEGTAGTDIWVYDLPSGVLSRLTAGGRSTRPEWTADGGRVAYIVYDGERPPEARWVPADKSGPEERLHAMPGARVGIGEVAFSPDGRLAVFRTGTGSASGGPTRGDLSLLPLGGAAGSAGSAAGSAAGAGERRAAPLLQTPANEASPRVSPDGRWLAYVSDETGQYEVYVRPFPGPGGRVQVSAGGGAEPVWAPDKRRLRLVYRAGDRFVTATLTPATAPAAGAPGTPSVAVAGRRVLFEGPYLAAPMPILVPRQYDVHPDGRRFVVLRPTSEDRDVVRDVVVVVDWLAEVRARAAATWER